MIIMTSYLLDGCDVLADLDGPSNDFVANAEGKRNLAPAAGDGVHIGAADTTRVNRNVYVAVLEWLELELKRCKQVYSFTCAVLTSCRAPLSS